MDLDNNIGLLELRGAAAVLFHVLFESSRNDRREKKGVILGVIASRHIVWYDTF